MDADDELTLTSYRFLARCALLSALAGVLIDGLVTSTKVAYWMTSVHGMGVISHDGGTRFTPYELWTGLGLVAVALFAQTRRAARHSTWPFAALVPPSLAALVRHWELGPGYNSNYERYVTYAGERMLVTFKILIFAAPALAFANAILFDLEARARRRQSPLPAAKVTSRAARLRSPRSPTDRPASPSD